MRSWSRALPAIALAAICAVPLGAATNTNRGSDMTELIQTARDTVQQYDKSRELLLLRQAGEQLERVDLFALPSPEQRADARLRTLQTWLLILLRVDAAKDPTFNPDDPPALKVEPRSVPGQPSYPPGIAPAQIADPTIRAEYEAAIAENQRKTERAKRYWDWQALEMELSDGAKHFISRYYTASPVDHGELRETMAKAGLSAQRQRQLDAAVRR